MAQDAGGYQSNPLLAQLYHRIIPYQDRPDGKLFVDFAIARLLIVTEEENFHNQLGVQYEKYCSQIPRYIFGFKSILPKKQKM